MTSVRQTHELENIAIRCRYLALGLGLLLVTGNIGLTFAVTSRQAACESYRKRTGKIHPKCTEADSQGATQIRRGSSSDTPQEVAPVREPQARAGKASGPDILGIQIGMTPNEVRSLVKARQSLTNYREYKGQLAYRGLRNETKAVPGSEYITGIHGWSISTRHTGVNPATEALLVTFSADSGDERTIAVSRRQHFAGDQSVATSTYEQGLASKFGPANFRTPGAIGASGNEVILYWYFDAQGSVIPRRDDRFRSQCTTLGVTPPEAREVRNIQSPIFSAFPYDLRQKQCGAYGLAVTLNATRVSGGKLLDRVEFLLAGYPQILAARASAARRTHEAQQSQVNTAVRAGSKGKPDL